MPVRTFVGLAAYVNETAKLQYVQMPGQGGGGVGNSSPQHNTTNNLPARIGRGDNDIGRLER